MSVARRYVDGIGSVDGNEELENTLTLLLHNLSIVWKEFIFICRKSLSQGSQTPRHWPNLACRFKKNFFWMARNAYKYWIQILNQNNENVPHSYPPPVYFILLLNCPYKIPCCSLKAFKFETPVLNIYNIFSVLLVFTQQCRATPILQSITWAMIYLFCLRNECKATFRSSQLRLIKHFTRLNRSN